MIVSVLITEGINAVLDQTLNIVDELRKQVSPKCFICCWIILSYAAVPIGLLLFTANVTLSNISWILWVFWSISQWK